MKYISEINTFYDWLELNELSTSAVALWYALMHINNKAAWVETFTVAESVLSVKTGLSGRGVRNARNELKQKGRIDFRSRAGGRAPVYTIIPFETGINCLNDSSASKRVPISDGAEEVPKEMSSEEIIPTETDSVVHAGDTSVGCAGGTSVDRATLIEIEIDKEIDNIITITKEKEPWVTALEYFCKKSKRTNTQLKPRELEAAQSVCKQIPIKIVLQGINQAFLNYKPDNEGDRINSFKYCEPIIKKLYSQMKAGKESSNGRSSEKAEHDDSGIGFHF